MKLHFESNQPHQLDAIKSVIGLFQGQLPLSENSDFFLSAEGQTQEPGFANILSLEQEQILKNLHAVQKKNGLDLSQKLESMDFSVEMETGTGKTYVYLRTIYELHQNYGFKKFVIVTPSVAIREGALKNLKITREHFQNLYNRVTSHFSVYSTKSISALRNFYTSNSIEILVINIDSFAKDENVIRRFNDKLMGRKPIEFIQSAYPIVIVDEPQNMESEIRRKALESLNPLFTLRYSATHIKDYNMLYRLDPVRACDLALVKQIEVDSIVTENDFNQPYVELLSFHSKKRTLIAKIKIDVNDKDGVKRKTVVVGDNKERDLYVLSNEREIYKGGYIANSLNAKDGFVEFANGRKVWEGKPLGAFREEVIWQQIRKTIEEHFSKERKYFSQGIKVLSLFFIDRVSNYRTYDDSALALKGKLARCFEEAYKDIASKAENKGLPKYEVEQVHNGYFSQDKGRWKDTRGNTKADDDTFKLIMQDKERLLSLEEPLRFIFSHSALREGWDNPNVFQICTLNETHSDLKKRQEIGRGLRLCVNQEGHRVQDKSINCLTVIANEAYEDFARQLQREIEDECGVSFKDYIKNKRDRKSARYRKGFQLDEKFKAIWDKIKEKTVYKVEYSAEKLIESAAKALKDMPKIEPAKIRTTKAKLKLPSKQKSLSFRVKSSSTVEVYNNAMSIPDLLFYIEKRNSLSRSTIAKILLKSGRLADALLNPQLFLDYSLLAIENELAELMIDGIRYEKIGDKVYEMHLFQEYDIYVNDLVFKIKHQHKTIYDELVPLDSKVEYNFAKECEAREDIEFYFKLPFWFKIKTPIGNYNPDWALIKKNEKIIYFVAETKSENQELRPSEERKIKCGRKHFENFPDVEYRKVSKVSDL